MSIAAQPAVTFADLLTVRAATQPNDVAYMFLGDGRQVTDQLTYQELSLWSLEIASRLRRECRSGDRILLLFPSGLEYIAALLGCFYAGMIAVPAYPPNPRHLQRLRNVVADCRPALTLSTDTIGAQLNSLADDIPEIDPSRVRAVVDRTHSCGEVVVAGPVSDDVAFLQYTSGSTSDPKGVRVTHGNLIANQEMIQEAFGHTPESVILGWLPMFHDMGLVGNVLQPLFVGARCILMSPLSFLQRPARWIQAVSDFGATTSGGPNFAFDLCVNRVRDEDLEDVDLSCWELAFNGSEPVRSSTMESFAERFAAFGFRKQSFYPCYGMAEATLLISGGDRQSAPNVTTVNTASLSQGQIQFAGSDAAGEISLVTCGTAPSGQTIRIVDPKLLTLCPDGSVGEIWVSGANVADGYWENSDLSAEVFRQAITSSGESGFMRTGDLGVIHDGELVVVGRLKDTIIICGRNLYPADIEASVQSLHPHLAKYCSAVFSVPGDKEESLVIVQEISPRDAKKPLLLTLSGDIQEIVTHQFEVKPKTILFVRPGSVPKTSSGKVRRAACREHFLAGSLVPLI